MSSHCSLEWSRWDKPRSNFRQCQWWLVLQHTAHAVKPVGNKPRWPSHHGVAIVTRCAACETAYSGISPKWTTTFLQLTHHNDITHTTQDICFSAMSLHPQHNANSSKILSVLVPPIIKYNSRWSYNITRRLVSLCTMALQAQIGYTVSTIRHMKHTLCTAGGTHSNINEQNKIIHPNTFFTIDTHLHTSLSPNEHVIKYLT